MCRAALREALLQVGFLEGGGKAFVDPFLAGRGYELGHQLPGGGVSRQVIAFVLDPYHGNAGVASAIHGARHVSNDSRCFPGFGHDANLDVYDDERRLVPRADCAHTLDRIRESRAQSPASAARRGEGGPGPERRRRIQRMPKAVRWNERLGICDEREGVVAGPDAP